MNLIQRLLGRDQRSQAHKTRALRGSEIERLGFRMVDRSGWFDGKYTPKAYVLEKDGIVIAGPFASSVEALRAAQELANPKTKE